MPTFVYLAPLTLFFLIGPAAATIATVIYAAPPAIRLTAHAHPLGAARRRVEAADSLGSTRAADAAEGAAADGQADRRHRHQPDDHGRAVDGDHRGADRRPRPRQDRAPGAADARRRHGVQRRASRSSSWRSCSTGSPPRPATRGGGPAHRRPLPQVAPAAARRRRAWSAARRWSTCPTPTCGRPSSPADGERRQHASPSAADAVTTWAQDDLSAAHRRRPGRRHQRPAQPAPGAADRLARGGSSAAVAGRARRWCSAAGARRSPRPCCAGAAGRAPGVWQDSMITLASTLRRDRRW